jgi:alpha-tubulin suppressor-like RCC1 family protein
LDQSGRSSPVQVGGSVNWKMVTAGDTFSAATKNDGTLWTWGNNSFGQLGQGDYTHRSSPIQVGTVSQYVSVYAMSNTLLANLF